MYQLTNATWIRPELVNCVEIIPGTELAFVYCGIKSINCTPAEARALLEHLNGAYNDAPVPPAADVPGKMRHIISVECYISNSGNKTWKGISDAAIVYFRQANRELLEQASLWHQLDRMQVGDVWIADIVVYTVPDGDFHKPIRFDQNGLVFPPDTWHPTHIEPLNFDTDDDDSDD